MFIPTLIIAANVLFAPPSNGLAAFDEKALQIYRTSEIGIDVDYAWSLGIKGQGIRISDCETSWNSNHEDLLGMKVVQEPGQTRITEGQNSDGEHGAAVLGVMGARDDGIGVTGGAHLAEFFFFPTISQEEGERDAKAVAAAAANSRPGDIIVMEMQSSLGMGSPAEVEADIWKAVRAATDAGVIVVAAAGNAGADLDSETFSEYRQRGDSGAIIVGGGSPDAFHDSTGESFGSRVDLQGFSDKVLAPGYFAMDPISFATREFGEDHRYGMFNGTSSATAVVAQAVALVQSFSKERLGYVLTPTEMRALLVKTGKPQGSFERGKVGPLPDIKAAIEELSKR